MDKGELSRATQTISHVILLSLGVVYLFLAVGHQLVIADPQHKLMLTALASFSALIIFISVAFLKYTKREAATFSQILFIAIMATNSFVHMGLTQEIIQSTNIIIIVLAMGGLFTINRLYYGVLAVILVVWAALICYIDMTAAMRIHFSFAAVLSVVASTFVFRNRAFIVSQLFKNQKEIEYLANNDPLTGCLRRHAFDQRAESLLEGAVRDKAEVGMLFCDIDYFKRLNDSLGHGAGDVALREMGRELMAIADEHQLICGRMGGEEFALMGVLDNDRTEHVAVAINQRVQALNVSHPDSPVSPWMTTSVGYTSCRASQCNSLSELCKVADGALYQAKRSGRNHVVRTVYEADSSSAAP